MEDNYIEWLKVNKADYNEELIKVNLKLNELHKLKEKLERQIREIDRRVSIQ